MQEANLEDMARKRTRKRSKQRRRRKRCEEKPKPQTSRDQWTNVSQIYQTLFEWHHNHVMSLCHGNNPNQDQDLEDVPEQPGTTQCLDYVYESSSDEEEVEPIDEEYLKFLEVTIKHQQELRDRRAAQTTDSLELA
ncbi:uncharacterized protein LOC108110570 [Drosophila eugracilis]|uniref:uncharacterized protein LOC108110570 n=1 Tax=Drosophila eugracilis TaxID=29029 RepID=UPI0007E5C9EB|nr:uncharacterized protein LOC108110570 [Drosophila eugracilis]